MTHLGLGVPSILTDDGARISSDELLAASELSRAVSSLAGRTMGSS
jgi:hypothetical protein